MKPIEEMSFDELAAEHARLDEEKDRISELQHVIARHRDHRVHTERAKVALESIGLGDATVTLPALPSLSSGGKPTGGDS